MKKILALMLCILFVLTALASCGLGNMPDEKSSGGTTQDPAVLASNRDLSKIHIREHDGVGILYVIQSEEDFNKCLDAYIEGQTYEKKDYLFIMITYEKETVLTDEELSIVKYSLLVRYDHYQEGKKLMQMRIPFEDVNREDIMNLTANEKIAGLYFEYIFETVEF